MNILLTASDFLPYKALSVNLNADKKLLPYVGEAQSFDLKELIGSAFYLDLVNDIIGSPSLAKYSDLWNGSEWVCSGKTYKHEGLKAVLVYFSYARYALNSSYEETAFGIVVKEQPNSTPAPEKTILRKTDNARSGALSYFADVKRFLDDNHIDYPLWNYCCEKKISSSVSGVEPQDQRYIKRHRRGRYL